MKSLRTRALVALSALIALAGANACGLFMTFDEYRDDGPASRWRVRGVVEGLESSEATLVLRGERLVVRTGPFEFATPLRDGERYEVSIGHEPSTHACSLERSSGTIAATDASIIMRCASRLPELGSITLVNGTLRPAFTPERRSYAATIQSPGLATGNATSTRVIAGILHPGTVVSITGARLEPGAPSDPIVMATEGGSIDIDVTAASGIETARYTMTVDVHQRDFIKASNPHSNARFGSAIAIEGDVLVVGANGEQNPAVGINANQSGTSPAAHGAAYVFERKSETWTQTAYLKPGDYVAESAFFGASVAISNGTIVVGAPGRRAAYVFVRGGTGWVQHAKLEAQTETIPGWFGRAVAIDGDTIAVATPFDGDGQPGGTFHEGAVYVFARAGTTWAQTKRLVPPMPGECYVPFALSMSSDAIAVASPSCANANPGGVHVFRRKGGDWSLETTRPIGYFFGFEAMYGGPDTAVALANDLLLIPSAPSGSPPGSAPAPVAYRRTADGWSDAIAIQTPPFTPSPNAIAGVESVVIRGKVVVAAGHVRHPIFVFRDDGKSFNLMHEVRLGVTRQVNNALSMAKVAVSDRNVAISDVEDESDAPGLNGDHNDFAPSSGAVWLY